MLARYEAYKKIVDHEKAAILADYEKRLEEHRKLPRGLPGDLDRILGVVEELMPFVPAEKRQRLIEAAHLTAGYTEELAGIASTAPDLVAIADAAALKYLKAEDEAVTHRLGIISQRLDELFRQSAEKSAQTLEK